MTLKILWGVTGCGDYLIESIEVMKALMEKYELQIDIALSKAGEFVVKWYKQWETIEGSFPKIFVEKTANLPFLIGPLQLGKYYFMVISPASSNTVAKIAYGIADSLLTNCTAQAMKAGIHVYIVPTDQKMGEITTTLPSGKKTTLSMRKVDVENVEKLRRMKGITVLSSPREIERICKSIWIPEKRSDISHQT